MSSGLWLAVMLLLCCAVAVPMALWLVNMVQRAVNYGRNVVLEFFGFLVMFVASAFLMAWFSALGQS